MNTPEIDVRLGWTSASNAPADARCPGRHLAQRHLPDSEESEAAIFGTAIHEALKTDDPSKLQSDALSIYEGCMEIREKLIMEKFGMDASKVTRVKEERVWWTGSNLQHSAQLDLLCKLNNEGLIIEYKTLTGEVEDATVNEQLRDQVALAAGAHKLTEIDVAVVQPLVTYTPRVVRYTIDTIKRAQVEMAERVKASNDPNSKRIAGAVQCKFCKARFTCKEYSEFVSLAVPIAMYSLTSPVNTWTPEQRALFCERYPIATKWIEETKSQIKELIRINPESVPGWRLAPGDIRKTINNPGELHTRFIQLGGTTEQFMAAIEVGKGALEKQMRAATGLKGKSLKAKIDEILAGVVEEKQCDSSLDRIR